MEPSSGNLGPCLLRLDQAGGAFRPPDFGNRFKLQETYCPDRVWQTQPCRWHGHEYKLIDARASSHCFLRNCDPESKGSCTNEAALGPRSPNGSVGRCCSLVHCRKGLRSGPVRRSFFSPRICGRVSQLETRRSSENTGRNSAVGSVEQVQSEICTVVQQIMTKEK